MVLGEHGNSKFSTSILVSLSHVKVAHDEVNQSRLTGSVGADNSESGILVDGEIEVFENKLVLAVTELGILNFQERRHDFFGSLENESAGGVSQDLLDELHLIEHLDSALYESGSLGVGSELFDELLHVLDFFLLELVLFLLESSQLISCLLKLVVVTSVVD